MIMLALITFYIGIGRVCVMKMFFSLLVVLSVSLKGRCCFDAMNQKIPGCIGLIDDTLVYIKRKKTYIPNDLWKKQKCIT